MDDGLRAGLLDLERLRAHALHAEMEREVLRKWPRLDAKRLRHTVIRGMLNHFVSDIIASTLAAIEELGIASLEDVRRQRRPLLRFTPEVQAAHLELKRILRHELYEHPKVMEMAARSQAIVRDLFEIYMNDGAQLPEGPVFDSPEAQARAVSDYIAGMTDRFAMAEHARYRGHSAPD